MELRQIEKNLLLLLDPYGEFPKEAWHIVHKGEDFSTNFDTLTDSNIVYIFDRHHILHYLFFSFIASMKVPRNRVKNFYYLQDGLMAMIFPSKHGKAYLQFAKNHLPVRISLSAKIKSILPAIIKAEERYIFVRKNKKNKQAKSDFLNKFEFMFFSNPTGKLLVTTSETLLKGEGLIVKTTVNPAYNHTLLEEAETVGAINQHAEMKKRVPSIFKQLNTAERSFIVEEYVKGRTLREILRTPQVCRNTQLTKNYIDKLTDWFSAYRSIFKGKLRTISELYTPLFNNSNKFYHNDSLVITIINNLQKKLKVATTDHPGLTPIIAHNDLWPGNFLVTKQDIIAIDWERATPDRSEIFDYFWMIISATMEYLIGTGHKENYSTCFRIFLQAEDPVCSYTYSKLNDFMKKIGFRNKNFSLFMQLFLLEWSVQGQTALGRKTDMDDIAIKELKKYSQKMGTN